jgi:hypothetical protein
LAEATGQTVWAAKTGRAGIRFLDVPVDSRFLLQEWIRRRTSANPPSEPEVAELAEPAGRPAQPVAQITYPGIILAAAITLGIIGGIWLAAREEQPAKKTSISTSPVQSLPKVPISAAPEQQKTGGVISETPQAKLPDDRSQEKAIIPPAAAPQAAEGTGKTAPVQARTSPAVPGTLLAQPPVDQFGLQGTTSLLPAVQAMRFSHQPGLTRVEIDLGTSILLRHGRLHRPERIYFDVQDSHRDKGIVRQLQERKVGGTSDTVLTGIRVAPLRSGDVRVVLDLSRACEFHHRLSSEPASSLIVELQEPSAPAGEAAKLQ